MECEVVLTFGCSVALDKGFFLKSLKNMMGYAGKDKGKIIKTQHKYTMT